MINEHLAKLAKHMRSYGARRPLPKASSWSTNFGDGNVDRKAHDAFALSATPSSGVLLSRMNLAVCNFIDDDAEAYHILT